MRIHGWGDDDYQNQFTNIVTGQCRLLTIWAPAVIFNVFMKKGFCGLTLLRNVKVKILYFCKWQLFNKNKQKSYSCQLTVTLQLWCCIEISGLTRTFFNASELPALPSASLLTFQSWWTHESDYTHTLYTCIKLWKAGVAVILKVFKTFVWQQTERHAIILVCYNRGISWLKLRLSSLL